MLVALALAAPASAGECPEGRAHCFALQLHVAPDVASAEWLDAQVATANRHFAKLDVGYRVAGVDALPESAKHVASRSDRDAVAAGRLTNRVIHVFVVDQLDDIDIEDSTINGVTWRRPKDKRKYVILSARAWERTLAHELGHVFGLPHSSYPISIMNKTERDEPPQDQRTFADEEFVAMRAGLKRLLRVLMDYRRNVSRSP